VGYNRSGERRKKRLKRSQREAERLARQEPAKAKPDRVTPPTAGKQG
jgi:hypothetical protein